ncbi:MAG: hypothetical protein ISN26_06820 [Betaproteobacteria bacterium AqS2]|uniref:Uncharacterized protein n=1 Tax=Candidatus Amphirhobacter heronislandensis TaxID=1732024 RepID=A0A930UD86_9GAMM|nr:hypothetical protein [Betaproteobacteria bacterium AqS2]
MTAAVPAWLRPLALRPPPAEAEPAWRYLPLCLAAALLLRLGLGLFTDAVIYPEELQQYLEQGHRFAFGYGVTTWEWEYGARSPLLPGFIALLLLPFKWTGLDDPVWYVPFVKAVFCCISLLIPWGLYHHARHQHGERAGRIALLLGCVCFYLLVFAARPLVEIVATCAVLGLLGLLGRPFARRNAGAIVFGAVLGLFAYLRHQYLPAFGMLWLAAVLAMPRAWALRSALAGATVFGAGGVVDWIHWGLPFNKIYINILFNLVADDEIMAAWKWFYPQRLLFASAGGWLLALWAWTRRPRSHLPVIAIALAVFIPHTVINNKEFRFVFPLLVLWIPAAAALLAELRTMRFSFVRRNLTPAFLVLQIGFGTLLAAGAVKDFWLHRWGEVYKGDQRLGYLHNSPRYLQAQRWLHRQEDLEGLLVVHDDHNYYHLHRDVPIYNTETYAEALERSPGRKLVSHVVVWGLFTNDSYEQIKEFDGGIRVYRSTAPGPVHADAFDPHMRYQYIAQLAAKHLPPPRRR